MNEQLFPSTEVFQKERPKQPTEKQKEDFYSRMAKEIIKDGFSTSDEEDIIEDLKMLHPFNDNGFEMAKDLDSHRASASYDIDSSFCEWLDWLDIEYRKINEANVKEWVKAHNPQPKFENGTKLLINETICYGLTKGMEVYITGNNTERAYYTIDANPNKQGGTCIEYEITETKCSIINQENQQ